MENKMKKLKEITMSVIKGSLPIILATGLNSCIDSVEKMPVKLGVGDNYENIIRYNGQINENTFTVSDAIVSGPQAYSVENHYPISTKQISLGGNKFDVVKVTPDSLILNYYDRGKYTMIEALREWGIKKWIFIN